MADALPGDTVRICEGNFFVEFYELDGRRSITWRSLSGDREAAQRWVDERTTPAKEWLLPGEIVASLG
ncbi:hypothetical protein JJL56_28210 [Azospirillum sp. YIM DDC1]|uniref:Uncharacterized protein n=1 Tax=Azospirillum aestuarii TaxID=2802052 RepID=A0ABS1I6U6_9PROT|nr:hypothetical protein [Azospirillum aestuarii]MBK4722745.1 hypothetical protein [Azospirillum aestuarii]